MTVEEIKAMVRRLVEARNSHDVEASVSFFLRRGKNMSDKPLTR